MILESKLNYMSLEELEIMIPTRQVPALPVWIYTRQMTDWVKPQFICNYMGEHIFSTYYTDTMIEKYWKFCQERNLPFH